MRIPIKDQKFNGIKPVIIDELLRRRDIPYIFGFNSKNPKKLTNEELTQNIQLIRLEIKKFEKEIKKAEMNREGLYLNLNMSYRSMQFEKIDIQDNLITKTKENIARCREELHWQEYEARLRKLVVKDKPELHAFFDIRALKEPKPCLQDEKPKEETYCGFKPGFLIGKRF